MAEVHRLTVPGGRVDVDLATGAVTGLSVDGPGIDLIARPDRRGLLRLAAPLAGFAGHHAETGVHGRPEVERSGEGLRLRYGRMTTGHTTVPVRAEVELRPTEDGLVLRARVDNDGEQPIPQVVFPQLFGLGAAGAAETTRLQLGRGRVAPFRELTMRVDDASFFEQNLYRYLEYGFGPFNMKWLDYGDAVGGATLYSRDTRYVGQGLLLERPDRSAPRVELRWIHHPFVEPGQSWESPEFVLLPHAGDWYAGARAYRAFADVHYPYNAPRRIRDALGFRSIWLYYLTSPPMHRYADLPAIAAELDGLDLAELCVWDWFVSGGYRMAHSPRLGTGAELAEAVRACQAIGVPVSLFVSHHLLMEEPETRPEWLHLNAAGQRQLSNWTFSRDFLPRFRPLFEAGHSYVMGSALTPGWREQGLAEYRQLLDEFGADSICFDQYFAWRELEFNPARDGRPDEEGERLLEFGRRARELIHARHPEGTFSGEGVVDASVPVVDYTWEWNSGFQLAEAGPFRYVFPQFRLNANVNEHPRSAHLAFVEGAFLNVMPGGMEDRLAGHPRLIETLRELAALRRRFRPYFTEGRFRFEEGLSASGCVARLYTHEERVLVLATNPTDAPSDAALEIDRAALGLPEGAATLRALGPDGAERAPPRPAAGRVRYEARLGADDLLALELSPVGA